MSTKVPAVERPEHGAVRTAVAAGLRRGVVRDAHAEGRLMQHVDVVEEARIARLAVLLKVPGMFNPYPTAYFMARVYTCLVAQVHVHALVLTCHKSHN